MIYDTDGGSRPAPYKAHRCIYVLEWYQSTVLICAAHLLCLLGVWAFSLAKAPAMVGNANHHQRNGYIA
jgi:hypothetical protein